MKPEQYARLARDQRAVDAEKRNALAELAPKLAEHIRRYGSIQGAMKAEALLAQYDAIQKGSDHA